MSDSSLEALEPREVFSKFLELTRIPHGSGNEKALSDHLRNWAERKGLSVRQDANHNLLIAKPANKAAPGAPTVIIQAHLDMVCAKSPGSEFDFAVQPLDVFVDGDRLRAKGTTLGADDGIGVAFALALLDAGDDVPHPPLEIVLTTGEETGMYGAAAFDVSQLNGSIFINIDSEEEGIYYVSCAGGVRLDIDFPAVAQPVAGLPGAAELECATLRIANLRGGHSGVEIGKERGNSHRLTARVLESLTCKYPSIRLAGIHGGQADNAIPNATEATLLIRSADREKIDAELARWQTVFRNELKAADGKPGPDGKAYDVTVSMAKADMPEQVLTPETFKKILFAMMVVPTGVLAMDLANPEPPLPETSANLAMLGIADGMAKIEMSIRSQLASKKQYVLEQVTAVARSIGAEVTTDGDYPGWEFDPDSRIRPLIVETFEKQTGKKAVVQGVHAGLECGLFTAKAKALGKKLDCTSIGPDLQDVHTPDENLGIASTGRTWELLKEVLAVLAKEGVRK